MLVIAVGHKVWCWVIVMISLFLVLFLVSFSFLKERNNIKFGRQGGQEHVEEFGKGKKNMIKVHSMKKIQ